MNHLKIMDVPKNVGTIMVLIPYILKNGSSIQEEIKHYLMEAKLLRFEKYCLKKRTRLPEPDKIFTRYNTDR